MHDRSFRLLLRRIALGLPLIATPAVLVGCSSHCTPGATVSTRHAATDPVRARLGMGTAFDSSQCRDVCFELDGVVATTGDAGLADGGAMSMVGSGFAQTATVSCGWSDDSTVSCDYQGATQCTGGGSSCIIPPCAVAGRAPAGLMDARPLVGRPLVGRPLVGRPLVGRPLVGRGDIAAWLAEAARLEAASVEAFEDLAVEVALHDAPAELARWARACADDERRHAAVVGALAGRVGGQPAAVRRGAHATRGLFDIALDNASEGCVREAFGALTAAMQASSAQSASVRGAFGAIARDEARHALFSIELDAWARARLPAAQTRAIDEVRRAAHARLTRELENEAPSLARAVLGLPDASRAIDALGLVA
jgi:hypothetical protein